MPAPELQRYDLIIVGGGPVGLTVANLIAPGGARVLIVEKLGDIIDYPRGVGMDDECLRAFQAAGLADSIVPHTTPHQGMIFRTSRGRTFAAIQPKAELFGWPKRNAFIQPLVDRVLLDGLARFPNVEVLFNHEMTHLAASSTSVEVTLRSADGAETRIEAAYLVGCDGGRSVTRKLLDIPFEGRTDSTRWFVVDIAKDPIGVPNAILICDPARPYVTIALPHGIRRLEFLLWPHETEEQLSSREGLERVLATVLPDPASAHIIRSRVYTHHARLARTFRKGRVLLAGDAAHLMPVWQGQGFNSGIRDANNLAWKLAAVLGGISDAALLDTYEEERREHARAMIDLSTLVGRIFSPTNRLLARLRDIVFGILNRIPPVRDYVVQMRFKPMPRYLKGVLLPAKGRSQPHAATGRLFIQPRVTLGDGSIMRLDDAIGYRFAIVAWAGDPGIYMTEEARSIWSRLGGRTLVVRSSGEIASDVNGVEPSATLVGDTTLALKDWFAAEDASVVILRPDRIVAGVCRPQEISAAITDLGRAVRMARDVTGARLRQ